MKIGKLQVQGNVLGDCWELIYYNTLSEAATSISISGLDGDTDKEYKLIIRLRDQSTNGFYGGLRFNNDTGANYGLQVIKGTNTTAAASQATAQDYLEIQNFRSLGHLLFSEIQIYAKSGYLRTILIDTENDIDGNTIIQAYKNAGVWNNTINNLTSIILISFETDGLGIGTVIELYRKSNKV